MIILDTIPVIVNNIIPGKSNFEIYAPYIAVFVSLFTVVVNIWLNNRQIKNSHHILEKNIDASWKNKIKENKINVDFKLLEEYGLLRQQMIETMKDIIDFKSDKAAANVLHLNFIKCFSNNIDLIERMNITKEEYDTLLDLILQFDIYRVFFETILTSENSKKDEDKYKLWKQRLEKCYENYIWDTRDFIKSQTDKILSQ